MTTFCLPTLFRELVWGKPDAPVSADMLEDFNLITDPLIRIEKSGYFRVDDITLLADTYAQLGHAPNSTWDQLRNKHLTLPDWFKTDLDPMSDEYFAQQMRLWQLIAGVDREYVAEVDELEEAVLNVDAIRRPGFYIWRNDAAIVSASDHVLATGMLMKHSGLKSGMWALEYGAGFAQTALAFARMGVNVDTVDISSTFCGYVKEQADFFGVNLTPFNALFGDNPRGDQKYDLIWFYESFHHCVDFRNVVQRLKSHLTPTGRILLAGEPVAKRENLAIPYPWGLRLQSDVVAVIRNLRWFELGFSEDFLTTLFVNNGYTAEYFDCPMSIFGQVYCFMPRSAKIELGKYWAPSIDEDGWHAPESTGRWTRGHAAIVLDQTDNFTALEIVATNHHPNVHPVTIAYGDFTSVVDFRPGECKSFRIDATIKAPRITLSCRTIVPGGPGLPSTDTRDLGLYVQSFEYV